MKIQKAAQALLLETGEPLSSKELSKIALERGMVISSAQDPVQSHAQTIEKNIRENLYNNPRLIFIHSSKGRLIGLPGWDSAKPPHDKTIHSKLIEINISSELFEKIKLAEQSKIKNNFDDTVNFLLMKGLIAVSDDIKVGLMKQMESLNTI